MSLNLGERNVLIRLDNNGVVIENDWLGSIPIFYNKKKGIVSTLVLKCESNHKINTEAFYNYCSASYSILEQTPFDDVFFLRYFSKICYKAFSNIEIIYKPDEYLDNLVNQKEISNPSDTYKLIKEKVNKFEASHNNDIIIPTSGGYDSRFLNLCISHKSRVRVFTYGIGDNQSNSFEAVLAKKAANKFDIPWKLIVMENHNLFIPEWYKLFGFSTHLHGMYHIEFYKKIKGENINKNVLLSGIIGDGWSGKVKIPFVNCPAEIENLFYNHGAKIDSKYFSNTETNSQKTQFYDQNRIYLKNELSLIVFAMRFKLVLLSYLLTVPEYFGFPCNSPFLDYEVVLSMLTLPTDQRDNRVWQKNIFNENGILFEKERVKADYSNTLDYQSWLLHEFEPINKYKFSGLIDGSYIDFINTTISGKPNKFTTTKDKFINTVNQSGIRGIPRVVRYLGLNKPRSGLFLTPYKILKSIEYAIQ